jgi:hypothetical protein
MYILKFIVLQRASIKIYVEDQHFSEYFNHERLTLIDEPSFE